MIGAYFDMTDPRSGADRRTSDFPTTSSQPSSPPPPPARTRVVVGRRKSAHYFGVVRCRCTGCRSLVLAVFVAASLFLVDVSFAIDVAVVHHRSRPSDVIGTGLPLAETDDDSMEVEYDNTVGWTEVEMFAPDVARCGVTPRRDLIRAVALHVTSHVASYETSYET